MINRTHAPSVVRQCQILGLSRSTAYSQPTPVLAADLMLMHWIDALHLEYPFAGARMLRDLLRKDSCVSGWRHEATLMRRMGITAVYRTPLPASGILPTRPIPISCATWRPPTRTMSGRLIAEVALSKGRPLLQACGTLGRPNRFTISAGGPTVGFNRIARELSITYARNCHAALRATHIGGGATAGGWSATLRSYN